MPHIDQPGLIQAITFRLRDSVPADKIAQWRNELGHCIRTGRVTPQGAAELHARISRCEDAGWGACHLRNARVAESVQNALLHFHESRYWLLAWCIMPNHVHVLVEPRPEWTLAAVVHGWKSFTAKQANQILNRTGTFWEREYHDRFIRDGAHFDRARHYIEWNPVDAGLAASPAEWPWSSAGYASDQRGA